MPKPLRLMFSQTKAQRSHPPLSNYRIASKIPVRFIASGALNSYAIRMPQPCHRGGRPLMQRVHPQLLIGELTDRPYVVSASLECRYLLSVLQMSLPDGAPVSGNRISPIHPSFKPWKRPIGGNVSAFCGRCILR
jgi:hypothetical protein